MFFNGSEMSKQLTKLFLKIRYKIVDNLGIEVESYQYVKVSEKVETEEED